jgi:predicted nucleic acid-binding protein
MKWTVVRSWGETRRERLDSWIADRPVIPPDRSVVDRWGELVGAAQLRRRPRPQPDTRIAACCIRPNVPLVTRNTADCADFADNDVLVRLSDESRAQANPHDPV